MLTDTPGVLPASDRRTLDPATASPNSTLTTAFDLGSLQGNVTHAGSQSNQTTDSYRFSLPDASNVNVALMGLSPNTAVVLGQDRNQDGTLESAEVIQQATVQALDTAAINVRSLAAGTYYIAVAPDPTARELAPSTDPRPRPTSQYTLNLSTSTDSNFLSAETDLGTLTGVVTHTGTIDDTNTADVYRFNLDASSAFNLALTGSSADIDIRLLRDVNGNGIIDPDDEVTRSQRDIGLDEVMNLRSLAAGTYFVQVYQYSGNTDYTLSLSPAAASNLLPVEANVGVLTTAQSFSGNLDDNNTADVFRFGLDAASHINLNLSGLGDAVTLRLIQDHDGDAQVANSAILQQLTQSGTTPTALAATLSAGIYFVQVLQDYGSTSYQLTFSATAADSTVDPAATSSALPSAGAGSTLATAQPITLSSSNSLAFSDFINSSVPNDYYRFSLSAVSNFSVSLANLTADADVQLIRDTNGNGVVDDGEVLAGSYRPGNASESFTVGLDAGTYFLRVFQYSGGTTFTLSLTADPIVLPSGYNLTYGYGLVDASMAIAKALGQSSPPAAVPSSGNSSWNLDLVDAPAAWAKGYTGQGVVVAVVDTGVDYTHPDLQNNIWTNSREIPNNGIDDDGDGFVDDVHGWDFVDHDNTPTDLDGHGTHVSGIVAAARNDFGVTGVAYNAKVMPVRVLGPNGGSNTDVATGIRYAVNQGANIINLSLGGSYSSDIVDAVHYAWDHNVLVVMAAGNEGSSQPGFPAELANQWGIAVGAIDSNKKVADFSNRAGVNPLNYVVAPGVNVYSTTPNNTYQYYSGTSMATPEVSGVAALLLSANPKLTPAQLISLLTMDASRQGLA